MIVTMRAIVAGVGIVLLGAILWAAFGQSGLHGGFWDQVDVMTTIPWGVVTLADLYAGFVFFAVIVFLAERSWLAAALWSIPILFLGNIWSAVWLVLRLPSLARRINRPDITDR